MAAGGKVIHVSDKIHQKVKKFCKRHGFKMTTWVEDILLVGMKAVKEVEAQQKR